MKGVRFIQSQPNNIIHFLSQLDYTINNIQDRFTLLHKILHNDRNQPHSFLEECFYEYYNPNIKQSDLISSEIYFFQKLETFASYIIYNGDYCPDDIVKPLTQQTRDKKHVSLNGMLDNPSTDFDNEFELAANKPAPTKYLQHKPEITPEDRVRIPALQALDDYINALEQHKKKAPAAQQWRIQRIQTDVRQEQHIIKNQWDKPIHFKALEFSHTDYTFDEDTSYIDDDGNYHLVSHNVINLSNPKHVLQLLNHYSQLRHQHYDDTQSDMRYILDSLDQLIEDTGFKEVFYRLIVSRIDGKSFQDISNELQSEYALNLSVSYLSTTFAKHIPEQIAKTHEAQYHDWYNREVVKGDYKVCSNPACEQPIKLRNERHFRKDKKSKDGFSSVCKACRK